jgi:2,3-bisphosphoglycerate-independent phosphoglycerate mutase
MGISAGPGQVIFRCNLVTIQEGNMVSFTAGHVENEDGLELIAELNRAFSGTLVQFFPGVSYRNIALLPESLVGLQTSAPHDITDKPVGPHWPQGTAEAEMTMLIEKARVILAASPVNARRIQAGKLPVTDIWPWSQGVTPQLPSFKDRHGLSGGIVTAVDLLRGLAYLTGLEYPMVHGATGFLDTNYANKMAAALDILDRHPFVFIHIEAPDECGHLGDEFKKVQAIEDFDRNIVGPVLAYQRSQGDVSVLVLPDHPTPCVYKTHINEPIPAAVYYPGIVPDSVTSYSESAVRNGSFNFESSWEMIDAFFAQG